VQLATSSHCASVVDDVRLMPSLGSTHEGEGEGEGQGHRVRPTV
jgi:hypothetical protein